MIITYLYINLDGYVERKKFIEDQFKQINKKGEAHLVRIPGVYGKFLTEEQLEIFSPKEKASSLNGAALYAGEIGCALSHRKCYDYILKHKLPYAVILEDDVTIPFDFHQRIESLIEKNNHSWDYVSFDYTIPGIPYLKFWLRSIKIRTRNSSSYAHKIKILSSSAIKGCYIFPLALFESFRNSYKKKNPGAVIFLRPLYLAGCYLLTQEAAKILRDLNTPIVYPADKVHNQARVKKNLKVRAYAPQIVGQEKLTFGSIITGKSGKDL
jgi:GR25 family glycosyltransferase involved in LPS biosynthesis